MFAADTLRQQFPTLQQQVHGRPLVYFDNAATAQKPLRVLKAMDAYYQHDNSNVHRGAHTLSDRATAAFEEARKTVREFINAESHEQVIWCKGTTEAMNLVAQSYGRKFLNSGDLILVSTMEHHANIVPWQMLATEINAHVKPIPVTDQGEIDLAAYRDLLAEKPSLVAITHVSNALGTINPITALVREAREAGAITVVDGAQAVAHLAVDVQAIDCDFYAFSAHKLFGPTGIGILYGKRALLEKMPPWQGGGEMIEKVSFSGTTFNEIPFRFEAGTPPIAEAIGFAEAIRFMQELHASAASEHEQALLQHMTEAVHSLPQLNIVGTAAHKVPVISISSKDFHPTDLGFLLDQQGFALRTGHHCAQPLMARYGLSGTLRASLAPYNTHQEVDSFLAALKKSLSML